MAAISVDALSKAIDKELKTFVEASGQVVDAATKQAAKDGVRFLHSASPKRSGNYAASWAEKKGETSRMSQYSRVIYSKAPNYRLTHLLENGHAKVLWGHRTGERVPGIAHIAPAEAVATENMVRYIKEGIDTI